MRNGIRSVALVLTCVIAVIVAAPAEAVTLAPPRDVPRSSVLDLYQQWADASKIPTPDRTVFVALVDCDHISPACVRMGASGWYLRYPDYGYLATYGERELLMARVEFMHELGHIVLFENPRLGRAVARGHWDTTP